MKRVGILVGREQTFPESIINSINERGKGEVVAEMVMLGGIRMNEEKKYDVAIDRISHEVPFYRATLTKQMLDATADSVGALDAYNREMGNYELLPEANR